MQFRTRTTSLHPESWKIQPLRNLKNHPYLKTEIILVFRYIHLPVLGRFKRWICQEFIIGFSVYLFLRIFFSTSTGGSSDINCSYQLGKFTQNGPVWSSFGSLPGLRSSTFLLQKQDKTKQNKINKQTSKQINEKINDVCHVSLCISDLWSGPPESDLTFSLQWTNRLFCGFHSIHFAK